MAFFTTFYSFKGGVGRTLALANVATLLARDKAEPCKVLVWDFDLAAPGLQKVFKCGSQEARRGFVDYVHHYLMTAEVDNISQYISKTDIDGVDILPAGALDAQYAQKLENIKWQQIYSDARGFHFIEAVKKQISDLRPAYDYVLIDSLTGYSDVGGICVRQLPDAVVFLFRLNDQNLSGIAKVYAALRQDQENKRSRIPAIPVISPAWPFASLEANEWIPRAAKIFPAASIAEISFEGTLTFGEPIIAKSKDKFKILPKIIQDYDALTRNIRNVNPQDVSTVYKDIPVLQAAGRHEEAGTKAAELIRLRPAVAKYWDTLVSIYLLSPKSEGAKFKPKALELLGEQIAVRNVFALTSKARLRLHDGKWRDATALLDSAIKIDPKLVEAYSIRASIYFARGFHQKAVNDYTKLLELPKSDKAQTYFNRGMCYLLAYKPSKALIDFDAMLEIQPRNADGLLNRAKVLSALGRYQESLRDAEKCIEISVDPEHGKLMKAYAYVGLRDINKAIDELKSLIRVKRYSIGNVAEAYLAIDPRETLKLLRDSRAAKEQKAIVLFLKAFAAQLLGDNAAFQEYSQKITLQRVRLNWAFFETKMLVRLFRADSRLESDSARKIKRLITVLEKSSIRD